MTTVSVVFSSASSLRLPLSSSSAIDDQAILLNGCSRSNFGINPLAPLDSASPHFFVST